MTRTQEGWIGEYQQRGALWIHDENPKRPHALLTSGKHSSGFFNSELVLEDPILVEEACADLVCLLSEQGYGPHGIDRVVGPAMGAITLAHEMARRLTIARRFPTCLRAYTEKDTVDGSKAMIFIRTRIRPGEVILLVEDVLTTGLSIDLTRAALGHNHVAPFVCVLVNRSGLTEVSNKQIVALIDHPMPIWTPDECPLCKMGSDALHPKSANNWKRLNAEY